MILIGWAIGVMLAPAVLIVAGLTVAGLYLLNIHGTQAGKLSATPRITC